MIPVPDHRLAELVEIGHDAYEAKAREIGHTSGSPVPWSEVPEPYRSCTIAAYQAVIEELADEATQAYNDGYEDGRGDCDCDR